MQNQFNNVNDLSRNIMSGFKEDEQIEKAHVKAHMRKTKSGKLSQVKDYDDSRTKKHYEINGKKFLVANRYSGGDYDIGSPNDGHTNYINVTKDSRTKKWSYTHYYKGKEYNYGGGFDTAQEAEDAGITSIKASEGVYDEKKKIDDINEKMIKMNNELNGLERKMKKVKRGTSEYVTLEKKFNEIFNAYSKLYRELKKLGGDFKNRRKLNKEKYENKKESNGFSVGDKVEITKNIKTIEEDGDLDEGYGKLLAGKVVEVIAKNNDDEYDIKVGKMIVHDVLLKEIVKDNKLKVSSFTDSDWDGFSGAEEFENGDQPLISEMSVGSQEFVIIAHKEGVEVIGDDSVFQEGYSYPVKTSNEAKEYLQKLFDNKKDHEGSALNFFRDLKKKNESLGGKKESNNSKSNNPIGLKPFTDSDWDGFSGAEEFKNGDQPLMGEMRVNGIDYVVIVSNGIIGAYGFDNNGKDISYHQNLPFLISADKGIKTAEILFGKDGNKFKEMNFFKNRGFKRI